MALLKVKRENSL